MFVALAIPEQVKERIGAAQSALRRVLPSKAARWTRPQQFHLTLRFLGNVAATRVDELIEVCRRACAAHPSLELRAESIGFFPNARAPRVVWAGIHDSNHRLAGLWRIVQSVTGAFTTEQEESQFTGHVTLARVNRLRRSQATDLAQAAAGFEKPHFGGWKASQLDLMRSELLPEGARHTLLASLPLADQTASGPVPNG